MAWAYRSPIGTMYIRKLEDGRYGLLIDGIVWGSSHNPQALADNVFCHATGCYDWDRLDTMVSDVPTSIHEWEKI